MGAFYFLFMLDCLACTHNAVVMAFLPDVAMRGLFADFDSMSDDAKLTVTVIFRAVAVANTLCAGLFCTSAKSVSAARKAFYIAFKFAAVAVMGSMVLNGAYDAAGADMNAINIWIGWNAVTLVVAALSQPDKDSGAKNTVSMYKTAMVEACLRGFLALFFFFFTDLAIEGHFEHSYGTMPQSTKARLSTTFKGVALAEMFASGMFAMSADAMTVQLKHVYVAMAAARTGFFVWALASGSAEAVGMGMGPIYGWLVFSIVLLVAGASAAPDEPKKSKKSD